MRVRILGIGLVALTLNTTAGFAETRQDRLAEAQGYIEATLRDLNIAGVIQGMWKPLVAQIEASGIKMSEDQLSALDTLYQDQFTAPMNQILREQADVMADIYTLDEIKALSAFYATDLGRAAIVKMPQLLERQTPMIMEMMQTQMPQLMPQIKAILDES